MQWEGVKWSKIKILKAILHYARKGRIKNDFLPIFQSVKRKRREKGENLKVKRAIGKSENAHDFARIFSQNKKRKIKIYNVYNINLADKYSTLWTCDNRTYSIVITKIYLVHRMNDFI